jgi:hypothetical protein
LRVILVKAVLHFDGHHRTEYGMERNQNQSLGLSVRCFKQSGADERAESDSFPSDLGLHGGESAEESSLNLRIGRLLNMLDK